MEFDNDRIIRPSYKIEIFYWVLLCILNPLVNCIGTFFKNPEIWPVIFLVNTMVFPAYMLYSKLVVPKFLFEKRYTHFAFITFAFFIAIQLFLFVVYSIVSEFNLSFFEEVYFSHRLSTILREGVWIVVNLGFATAISFIREALDEKDMMLHLQKDNTAFKLKYMRAQMNPHFLFNTLNSIYSLCLQKSDKAPEVVIKLAEIMRYLTYECNEEKIPLNKEIDFIRNYIEIEKLRYKADIRFSIEGETEGVMIEPYLFISFIENGFKHALDNSFNESFIYIAIKVEPDQIILNVINNTNIDLETQAHRINRKGIPISKSLLELLYPDGYALDIIQTEKEEKRKSDLRFKHAKDRLATLYPDAHTLDVILNNNVFTVSLIIKPNSLDKMHNR